MKRLLIIATLCVALGEELNVTDGTNKPFTFGTLVWTNKLDDRLFQLMDYGRTIFDVRDANNPTSK